MLSTPDGGQISLDWYVDKNTNIDATAANNDDRPIALFLPGLTGSSYSEYIQPLVNIASNIGYRPVVLNHRGICNTPVITPRLYCAANDEDLQTCLNHIRAQYPTVKLMATGISLGGIILSRYLIKAGDKSKINAAFLVSVCWDFNAATVSLEKLVNFPFNNYLTGLMISVVMANKKMFENCPIIDLKEVRKSRSLKEFDESFTRKLFNFDSVQHYYREASNGSRINQIKTATLCINSTDDIFSPEDSNPFYTFKPFLKINFSRSSL